jgi:hypothetical protein
MYRQAILGPFSQRASLVGLCDSNEGRLQLAAKGVLAAMMGQSCSSQATSSWTTTDAAGFGPERGRRP